MTERVYIGRDLLVKCWMTARKRDAIKASHTDQRMVSRPGHVIHFDGLRLELGVEIFTGQTGLADFSVTKHGDGGVDGRLFGMSMQIKASTHSPPFLRFNIDGSQRFKADVAILGYVPPTPMVADKTWCERNGYVDLIGWISREEFMERATIRNFGYGDRLVVTPPLNAMSNLRPWW